MRRTYTTYCKIRWSTSVQKEPLAEYSRAGKSLLKVYTITSDRYLNSPDLNLTFPIIETPLRFGSLAASAQFFSRFVYHNVSERGLHRIAPEKSSVPRSGLPATPFELLLRKFNDNDYLTKMTQLFRMSTCLTDISSQSSGSLAAVHDIQPYPPGHHTDNRKCPNRGSIWRFALDLVCK